MKPTERIQRVHAKIPWVPKEALKELNEETRGKIIARIWQARIPQPVKEWLNRFALRKHATPFEVNTYLREFQRIFSNPLLFEVTPLDKFLRRARMRPRMTLQTFLKRNKKVSMLSIAKKISTVKLTSTRIAEEIKRIKADKDFFGEEKKPNQRFSEEEKRQVINEIQRRAQKISLRQIYFIELFFTMPKTQSFQKNVRPMTSQQRERQLREVEEYQMFTPEEKTAIKVEIMKRPWLSEFDAHRIIHYFIGMNLIKKHGMQ